MVSDRSPARARVLPQEHFPHADPWPIKLPWAPWWEAPRTSVGLRERGLRRATVGRPPWFRYSSSPAWPTAAEIDEALMVSAKGDSANLRLSDFVQIQAVYPEKFLAHNVPGV